MTQKTSLSNYLNSLKSEFPDKAEFFDFCWEVWAYFSSYFLWEYDQILIELFYKNGEIFEGEDGNLKNGFSESILSRMELFAEAIA